MQTGLISPRRSPSTQQAPLTVALARHIRWVCFGVMLRAS